MTMSKDRVRFTIPCHRLHKSRSGDKIISLVQRVFGQQLSRSDWGDVIIICRPSQFARFLILRNNEGCENGFKELNPELYTPDQSDGFKMFDVSRNPNTVRT